MIFAEDILSALGRDQCLRLAEASTGKVVIEIGAEFGRSTIALASVAMRVHSVDWHRGSPTDAPKGDTLAPFLANLERHGLRNKVVVHLGRSEDVLPCLRADQFEVAFLDAEHTAEAVGQDLRLLLPLLLPGARLFIHDWQGGFPGYDAAIEAAARAWRLAIEVPAPNLAMVRIPGS